MVFAKSAETGFSKRFERYYNNSMIMYVRTLNSCATFGGSAERLTTRASHHRLYVHRHGGVRFHRNRHHRRFGRWRSHGFRVSAVVVAANATT